MNNPILPRRQPQTDAQRQAKRRASGHPIAIVLRDAAAIDALHTLTLRRGGVTAAVTYALKHAVG